MQVHLEHVTPVTTTDAAHNAFTDICQWQQKDMLAYRHAQTHWITPPGTVHICQFPPTQTNEVSLLTHTCGDVRDPKLIADGETLWCMMGIYLPHPAYGNTLSHDSARNILHTHITYSRDGSRWAPLTPILRPNYWGWSTVAMEKRWYVASYHTGGHLETSSLVLWSGTSLLGLSPVGVIYSGASLLKQRSGRYKNIHMSPSEPVLFTYDRQTMWCVTRTEQTMEVGWAQYPYEEWHWQDTGEEIHPSAVIPTPSGTLLVGRAIQRTKLAPPTYHVMVYALEAADATVTPLLELPSGGDCGYAGITPGDAEGVYRISYYSSHTMTATEQYGASLPGATVYVAEIQLTSESSDALSPHAS